MTGETNPASVQIERRLPWQICAAMAVRPVVYIPLGTIEWHGEHLPVGLDALTAHGVCAQAAVKAGGLVLPALHYGTGGGHGAYPWTIMMQDDSEISAQLGKTLSRLEDFGCKLAVLFSGHFADTQLIMIDHVAGSWNGRQGPMRVMATAVNRIEGLAIAPDHAGVFETTLLSALHPDLVQLERLPPLHKVPLTTDDWADSRHDPKHPVWGVFGPDPRAFDPKQGPALLAASVDWLIARVGAEFPRA